MSSSATPTPPSLPQIPSMNGIYQTYQKNQTTSVIDSSKLEYPLVPTNLLGKQGTIDIQVPQYLKELPKSKIEQFYHDDKLLRGYVLKKYGKPFNDLKREITARLGKQSDFTEKSAKNYDAQVKERIERINKLLKECSDLLDEFDTLEVSMYDKMGKMNKKNMVEVMEANLSLQNGECQKLIDDAMKSKGELTDTELSTFIERYCAARQQYYLKKEKLSRMHEDRVGEI